MYNGVSDTKTKKNLSIIKNRIRSKGINKSFRYNMPREYVPVHNGIKLANGQTNLDNGS